MRAFTKHMSREFLHFVRRHRFQIVQSLPSDRHLLRGRMRFFRYVLRNLLDFIGREYLRLAQSFRGDRLDVCNGTVSVFGRAPTPRGAARGNGFPRLSTGYQETSF